MVRLTNADLRQLIDFFADGYGVADLDGFAQHLMRALPKVVPCASISYNEINTRRHRMRWIATPDEATRFPGCEEIVSAHIGGHPIVEDAVRNRRAHWSRISDFWTRRELADWVLYHEFYRRVDVHYQLGIVYPSNAAVSMAIALNRDVKDFSDRDRAVLNVLVPYLRRAYDNAEAVSTVHAELAQLRRGVDASGVGVIVLGAHGHPQTMTKGAREWLRLYFGGPVRADALPPAVTRWLRAQQPDLDRPAPGPEPLVVDRGDRTLKLRLMRVDGQTFVILREVRRGLAREALEALKLTHREIDVLGWVVDGKTDPEIAAILGISIRTVQHHLERIYRKLDVDTRTAAAVRALEAAP